MRIKYLEIYKLINKASTCSVIAFKENKNKDKLRNSMNFLLLQQLDPSVLLDHKNFEKEIRRIINVLNYSYNTNIIITTHKGLDKYSISNRHI